MELTFKIKIDERSKYYPIVYNSRNELVKVSPTKFDTHEEAESFGEKLCDMFGLLKIHAGEMKKKN